MNTVPAEVLKEYVNSQKFSSTEEVMEAMKDMFRDVLQQVMEGELDETLGYGKNERLSNSDETAELKNYRNGYSEKTVKAQISEVQVKVPRDLNGEYEPKIIGKYNRNADGNLEFPQSFSGIHASRAYLAALRKRKQSGSNPFL